MDEQVELRTGLPSGAGGKHGGDNEGTWSLLEQEQEHAAQMAALFGGTNVSPPPPEPPPAAKKTGSK